MQAVFGNSTECANESGYDGFIPVQTDKGIEFYDNYVEYGTNAAGLEEFVIGDGCNRIVPIRIENIRTLISILEDIADMADAVTHIFNEEDILVYGDEDDCTCIRNFV